MYVHNCLNCFKLCWLFGYKPSCLSTCCYHNFVHIGPILPILAHLKGLGPSYRFVSECSKLDKVRGAKVNNQIFPFGKQIHTLTNVAHNVKACNVHIEKRRFFRT